MPDRDPWDRDAAVRWMRRVFKVMERQQAELLAQVNISPLDFRLRHWRERALNLFESTWAHARRCGITLDEEQLAGLYTAGFFRILKKEGMDLPESPTDRAEELARLFREDEI